MNAFSTVDRLEPLQLSGPVREGAMLCVTSERMALFGTEGGVFELWSWPLKIAHGFRAALFPIGGSAPLGAPERAAEVVVRPTEFELTQPCGAFELHQTVFASPLEPGIVLLYRVEGPHAVELEVSFCCDLRPMWPAGLGGQLFGRDADTGGFVATEELGRFAAWIGAPDALLVESAERVRFRLRLEPGAAARPFLVATAQAEPEPLPHQARLGRGDRVTGPERAARVVETARRRARYLVDRADELRAEARSGAERFAQRTVTLACDDAALAHSFAWSKATLARAWVDVPDAQPTADRAGARAGARAVQAVGRGMVAGFGPSRGDERPGRAWFFEADMLDAGRALCRLGDFDGARDVLRAVTTHQRADGRLPSQRSLAAGLCRWLDDYPYAHLEATPTLAFGSALELYWRASGDRDATRELIDPLERVVAWVARCVDGDGLVRTERAGLGCLATPAERERLSGDLTLQAHWVASLRATALIADELDRRELGRAARKELAAAERGFATFWREDAARYELGWLDSGLRTRTLSGFTAQALATGAGEPRRRALHARVLNRPELATDWGLRGFAPSFPWFDAAHEDTGAVRFDLTARAVQTLYREGLAVAGEELLRTCLATFGLASRGAPPRALRGDRPELAEPPVACDVAAASAWIEALLVGVLGIDVDAREGEVTVVPAYPLPAARFELANVGPPGARARLVIALDEPGASGDAARRLRIALLPARAEADAQRSEGVPLGRLGCLLPPCSEFLRATDEDGRELPVQSAIEPSGALRVEVAVTARAASFAFRSGPWVRMPPPRIGAGRPSELPRWVAAELFGEPSGPSGVRWELYGPAGRSFALPFASDVAVRVSGAELVHDALGNRRLIVPFPAEGDADAGFVPRRVELATDA